MKRPFGFDRAFTGVALELEPAESFRRKAPPPGVLCRLWPWMSGFRASLLFSLLAGLLLAVPGIAAPVLLGLFVDDVLGSGSDSRISRPGTVKVVVRCMAGMGMSDSSS